MTDMGFRAFHLWRHGTVIGLLLSVAIFAQAAQAARESVVHVPSRPGVTQGYYLYESGQTPRAIAVVFVGGEGVLALDRNGPTKLRGNFLFRVRNALARAGLLLAYPDAPSDQSRGLGNFRISANHAEDIKAMILALKKRADLPVFLIGTSRGTVSTANVAARLDPALIKGVLLTSTITERSRNKLRSVHDTPLENIRVPVLALAHRDDGCYVTPASDVPHLLLALGNAPRKDSVVLTGGRTPKSDPCEAMSQHGFFGIEDQAVKAMTDWIDSVLSTPSR